MKKVYPRPSKKGTQIRLAPILWASDFTYVVPFIPHDSLTERWYSPYLTIKETKDQGAKWPAFSHTARNQQSHESDPILTNSEAKLCFPRGGSHGESRVTGPVSLKPPVAWPCLPQSCRQHLLLLPSRKSNATHPICQQNHKVAPNKGPR